MLNKMRIIIEQIIDGKVVKKIISAQTVTKVNNIKI